MERLNNYNFRGYDLTIWFFRLIMLIAATIILLLFLLRINDNVTVREGEIVAADPQSDYKAPFEAQIVSIHVKEGQPVKTGDTLLVIQNLDFKDQHTKKKTEIEYLQKKIESISVLQDALEKRKAAVDQASAINARRYENDVNRLSKELRTLDEQYAYQKQRLSSAREKYVGDSILYKKDMLSKVEFNATKDASLTLREDLANMQSLKNKQLAEKNQAYNDFNKEQNNLFLSKVQLDENAQALQQQKNDFESQLMLAKEDLNKVEAELNRQYVIATNSGIVNYLFSTKQRSNLISKGDLLISVAPKNLSYYAKAFIPEKDLPYIKPGMNALLKLDAYHRFQHGPIRGKVSYIAERKENDKFYALIELPESSRFQLKSGYTFRGEIVMQRLPLYKYFFKKLFKKIDNA